MNENIVKYVDNLFNELPQYIKDYKKILIITDKHLHQIYKNHFNSISNYIYIIEVGEQSKDISVVEQITSYLSENLFHRSTSCLLAFGGGVVGDLTGFVASIYLRGIDYIQIPTSLLAMVDSSIGGKTGVNTRYGKNLIGSFYFPKYILIYHDFLKTLPREELINGMAEIIKISITSDNHLFNYLLEHNLDNVDFKKIISNAIALKINIVNKDSHENNKEDITLSREILNYGHTIGHAIEKAQNIKHGYAVSIGIVKESQLTASYYVLNLIKKCLANYNLPLDISDKDFNIENIIQYIKHDKKEGRVVSVTQLAKPYYYYLDKIETFKLLSPYRKIYYSKPNKDDFTLLCPSSKSEMNRCLILAVLGAGMCHIKNPLYSEDTLHMIFALKNLGFDIISRRDEIVVKGTSGFFTPIKNNIFVGNSGTCLRFLIPLIALYLKDKSITITGNSFLKKRPIIDLVDQLRNIGCQIDNKQLPITIKPRKIVSLNLLFNFEEVISSQYISGILMSLPLIGGEISIPNNKDKTKSLGFINLTLNLMSKFIRGFEVIESKDSASIKYKIIKRKKYINPPFYNLNADATTSIYFITWSVLTGNPIYIKNLNYNNPQSDYQLIIKLLKLLEHDLDIKYDGFWLYPNMSPTKKNIELDLDSSDTFMNFCIMALFRDGKTIIKNIENQNLKECRRLDYVSDNLKNLGFNINNNSDSITITGNRQKNINYKNTIINCMKDHRLSMTFSLLSTKLPYIKLNNINCVEKTYPLYCQDFSELGLIFEPFNYKKNIVYSNKHIILIGLPNAGKSTLGHHLSREKNWLLYDVDSEIENAHHIDIKKFIKKNGFQSFRDIELKTFKKLIKKISQKDDAVIISTGGGIVENENFLKSIPYNFQVIYIKRHDIKIDEKFYGMTLDELKEKREPLYESISDITYENNDTVDNFSKWISNNTL